MQVDASGEAMYFDGGFQPSSMLPQFRPERHFVTSCLCFDRLLLIFSSFFEQMTEHPPDLTGL